MSCDDEGDQAGEDRGDEGAGGEQLETRTGADGVGERGARTESGAGEEHEDPELAEDEVGGPWDLPRDRAGARDRAEAQADHQRPASRPELELATTREWHVDDAEQEPGRDAEREPERVDLRQPAFGVAERAGGLVDAGRRSDHAHPVAELEDDVVVAQQVVVAAPDSRRHHAEATRQIEVADPLARQTTVRHEDPAEVERRPVEREVVIAAVPDVAAERLDRRLRTDHDHRVARFEAVARRRDRHHAVVLDTAEPEAGVPVAQLADRRQPGRGHVDRPVDQLLDGGRRWRGFEPRRQPQLAAEEQREDRDHRRDRGRIRERVGDDRVAVGHGLGRGLQRRCVRGAAGEQPGPVGGRQVERPRDELRTARPATRSAPR